MNDKVFSKWEVKIKTTKLYYTMPYNFNGKVTEVDALTQILNDVNKNSFVMVYKSGVRMQQPILIPTSVIEEIEANPVSE